MSVPAAPAFRKEASGNVVILEDWPLKMIISLDFLGVQNDFISVAREPEDLVSFKLSNGVAVYRRVSYDDYGNWECERVSSEYSAAA